VAGGEVNRRWRGTEEGHDGEDDETDGNSEQGANDCQTSASTHGQPRTTQNDTALSTAISPPASRETHP
jgi:hypothetical protein